MNRHMLTLHYFTEGNLILSTEWTCYHFSNEKGKFKGEKAGTTLEVTLGKIAPPGPFCLKTSQII